MYYCRQTDKMTTIGQQDVKRTTRRHPATRRHLATRRHRTTRHPKTSKKKHKEKQETQPHEMIVLSRTNVKHNATEHISRTRARFDEIRF